MEELTRLKLKVIKNIILFFEKANEYVNYDINVKFNRDYKTVLNSYFTYLNYVELYYGKGSIQTVYSYVHLNVIIIILLLLMIY